MTDPRIARIERGLSRPGGLETILQYQQASSLLDDLRAWQQIAERHALPNLAHGCFCDGTCPDRQAADDAIDRLDKLWGSDARDTCP